MHRHLQVKVPVRPIVQRAGALRAEAAEAALLNKPFNAANVQAAVEAAIAACDPAEDLRGDIEYKTAMAGEMVKRALNKAWSRCA